MTPLDTLLLVLFILAAYPYVGYPLVLYFLSLWRREPIPPANREWPTVTLVISAFNEEAVILEKIHNLRQLQYPTDRLRILIGSDGSDDATVQLATQATLNTPNIEILDFQTRRGKPAVLHDLITRADTDVIALSDANTLFAPDALDRLVRWFADPHVGVVCGRLKLVRSTDDPSAELLYWRFETWLKSRENRLGAVLGANGGIYAFRRTSYVPLPPDTITDDFVLPMLIRRNGYRIVFDGSAWATEEAPKRVVTEFTRRVRIGAGNLQALWRTRSLLNPLAGWTAFSYWSHKVLRWTAPFTLVIAFVISVVHSQSALSRAAALAAWITVLLATIGWLLEQTNRRVPALVAAPYAFAAINAALAVGVIQLARGKHSVKWTRTVRQDQAEEAERPQP